MTHVVETSGVLCCVSGYETQISEEFLIRNFSKIRETVNGIHGKVHLWPYANQAL
jgi:hypothetical protein